MTAVSAVLLKMSSAASSLVVPMLMWGKRPPTHCITVLYLLRDQRTLVTGGGDGQVLLWEVDVDRGGGGGGAAQAESEDANHQPRRPPPWTVTPRHMLVGHTAPVRCVAKASAGQDCHHIVTTSENGEMFTWDTVDGRALESRRYPNHVHTTIQAQLQLLI